MRITDKQGLSVQKAYAEQVRAQEQKQNHTRPQAGDTIELSPQSQEFLAAVKALKELPPYDADKVVLLRQQIEAGTYKVDPKAIARCLLDGQEGS